MIYPWHTVPLLLIAGEQGIRRIVFLRQMSGDVERAAQGTPNDLLRRLVQCLDRYFAGQAEPFDLPLELNGTAFQQKVWAAVRRIPFGQIRTYREIAAEIGAVGAVRAVGSANAANPVPIIVPCHRVVRSDGGLGGYAGGLDIKDALLRLEGAIV